MLYILLVHILGGKSSSSVKQSGIFSLDENWKRWSDNTFWETELEKVSINYEFWSDESDLLQSTTDSSVQFFTIVIEICQTEENCI